MTVAYDAPTRRCLGPKDAPGTVALRDECLGLFAGSSNLGTCACRNVKGTGSPSCHRECRAWDAGFRQPGRGLRDPRGDELAWFLVDQHDLLSIQVVIWNRRIWSVTKPYWRTYGGDNPHLDHVHVEHNWHGAKKCTGATVRLAFQRWLGIRSATEPQEDDDMPAPVLLKGRPGFAGHVFVILYSKLVHVESPQTAADMGFEVIKDASGTAVDVAGVRNAPDAHVWKRLPIEVVEGEGAEKKIVTYPPLPG